MGEVVLVKAIASLSCHFLRAFAEEEYTIVTTCGIRPEMHEVLPRVVSGQELPAPGTTYIYICLFVFV